MICDPYAAPSDPLCNVSLQETIDSREHRSDTRGSTWILRYHVLGTMDECLVKQRLQHPALGIPTRFHGYPRRDVIISNAGWEVWKVEAEYGYDGFSRPVTSSSKTTSVAFSTVGGTKHLTQAYRTLYTSDDAPDLKGAINWDGTKVQGLDVIAANARYSETWLFSPVEIYNRPGTIFPSTMPLPEPGEPTDPMLAMNLFERWHAISDGFVHGVNPDYWTYAPQTFRGFKPGEALFAGVVGRQIDEFAIEVTFEFLIQRNRWENVPEGITITVTGAGEFVRDHPSPRFAGQKQVFVEGWDYVDVLYENQDEDPGDGQGKAVLRRPKHLKTAQVYRRADFALLGIPNYDPANEIPLLLSNLAGTDCAHDPTEQSTEKSGPYWDSQYCNPE